MSVWQLLLLYLLIGAGCGAAIYQQAKPRDRRALASAVVAVPLWPLWAPFAMLQPAAEPTRTVALERQDGHAHENALLAAAPLSPSAQRIALALEASLAAIAGSAVADLLGDEDAQAILSTVRMTDTRVAMLDEQIAHGESEAARAERRERPGATARLHADSLQRMQRLRQRDVDALEELADVCELLRAQLVLARFDSHEDCTALRDELWQRLEGLAVAEEWLHQ